MLSIIIIIAAYFRRQLFLSTSDVVKRERRLKNWRHYGRVKNKCYQAEMNFTGYVLGPQFFLVFTQTRQELQFPGIEPI